MTAPRDRKPPRLRAHAPFLRCVYCGRPAQKRVRAPSLPRAGVTACHNHDDLPALDPFYAIPDQWANA